MGVNPSQAKTFVHLFEGAKGTGTFVPLLRQEMKISPKRFGNLNNCSYLCSRKKEAEDDRQYCF